MNLYLLLGGLHHNHHVSYYPKHLCGISWHLHQRRTGARGGGGSIGGRSSLSCRLVLWRPLPLYSYKKNMHHTTIQHISNLLKNKRGKFYCFARFFVPTLHLVIFKLSSFFKQQHTRNTHHIHQHEISRLVPFTIIKERLI